MKSQIRKVCLAACVTAAFELICLGQSFSQAGSSTGGWPTKIPEFETSSIDISPNGHSLLISADASPNNKNLYLLDLSTLKIHRLTSDSLDDSWPSFSPSGKEIVYSAGKDIMSPKHLRVLNLLTDQIHEITHAAFTEDAFPHFSQDGKLILFCRSKLSAKRGIPPGARQASDIYSIYPDGSHITRVTHTGCDPSFPQMHDVNGPIYYVADREGPDRAAQSALFSIYNLPNAKPTVVTSNDSDCYDPRLTADGKCLVYLSYFAGHDTGPLDIFVKHIVSRVPTLRIAASRSGGQTASEPVTTDGRKIFFTTDYNSALSVVDSRSGRLHQIANISIFLDPSHWRPKKHVPSIQTLLSFMGGLSEAPSPPPEYLSSTIDVSPDGSELLFSAVGPDSLKNLYLLNLTSLIVSRLTRDPFDDGNATFGPGGKNIAFVRSRNMLAPSNIFTLNLVNGVERQLTHSSYAMIYGARFSGDGKKVVFTSTTLVPNQQGKDVDPTLYVYSVSTDGTNLRRVTTMACDPCIPQMLSNAGPTYFVGDNLSAFAHSPTMVYSVMSDQGAKPGLLLPNAQYPWLIKNNDLLYMSSAASGNSPPSIILIENLKTRIQTVSVDVSKCGNCDSQPVTTDGRKLYFTTDNNSEIWEANTQTMAVRKIADSSIFKDPLHWRPH
jgi:Tol biopolymer transport system component